MMHLINTQLKEITDILSLSQQKGCRTKLTYCDSLTHYNSHATFEMIGAPVKVPGT